MNYYGENIDTLIEWEESNIGYWQSEIGRAGDYDDAEFCEERRAIAVNYQAMLFAVKEGL